MSRNSRTCCKRTIDQLYRRSNRCTSARSAHRCLMLYPSQFPAQCVRKVATRDPIHFRPWSSVEPGFAPSRWRRQHRSSPVAAPKSAARSRCCPGGKQWSCLHLLAAGPARANEELRSAGCSDHCESSRLYGTYSCFSIVERWPPRRNQALGFSQRNLRIFLTVCINSLSAAKGPAAVHAYLVASS